ncbi:hypothetical protein RHSIM_Rhsim12G0188600 [Rhododendron simsii]|uniref:Uncharacterized protein n=1 Tax=Rhododendron simsii TaxID=118357 RepID=A0A834L9G5_RHOSS|nr:hypothetical protein RHSIM_Rhsim12G0188600 [Rhododendron simsii]
MSDEDWVKAAMTDDSVVVELLFRLHQSTPPPPSKKGSHPSLPLEWSVRQRRSKPIPHHVAAKKRKKPTPTARDSPTTPLSWSGGATSVSGGGGSASAAAADGFEESSVSPAKRTDAARSKVTATNETTTNKRAKKKKTLAELKEEEILLVKERRHLKRELATLRATVEKQRATNESLKRLKLNFESQPLVESVKAVAPIAASPGQTQQNVASCYPMPLILPPEVRIDDHEDTKQQPPTPKVSYELQPNQENKFAVPDLNLPLDDNFNS